MNNHCRFYNLSLDSQLDEILKRVLDAITIPEILSVMSGNWTPIQRLHPVVREYVLNDLLKKDASNARVEKLADEITESMRSTFDSRNLPEDMQRRIRPGYDVTTLTLHLVKKHTLKLLQLILSPLPATSTQPHPFAIAVRDWTTKFVEELVTVLAQSFQDGVTDASLAIKHYMQEVRQTMINIILTHFQAPFVYEP